VTLIGLVAGVSLCWAALALDRASTPWLALGLLPLAGVAGVLLAALGYGLAETFVRHAAAVALRRRSGRSSLRQPPR
jgi:hypothetical protein